MRSMSSTAKSAQLKSPSEMSFTGTSLTNTSVWLASAPRMRACVIAPRLPSWLMATPGTVRKASATVLKPLLRNSSPVITVTAEPTLLASVGAWLA